ncbi:MAG: hypothetical protein ACI4XP_06440 [Acutalibacteraceae bacterium]
MIKSLKNTLKCTLAVLVSSVLIAGCSSVNDTTKTDKTSTSEQSAEIVNTAETGEVSDSGSTTLYYVTDDVPGENISVHVHCAYLDNADNYKYVSVFCTITNCSGNTIDFDSGKYFLLNNDGVIASGVSSDYDHTKIKDGVSIQTTLHFQFPESADMNLDNMIMMIDGKESVFLADKLQTASELPKFNGIYYPVNEKTGELTDTGKWIIEHISGDQYRIMIIMTNETYNVTLNSDNTFSSGNINYKFDPRTRAIYYAGSNKPLYKKRCSYKEMYENWTKTWPVWNEIFSYEYNPFRLFIDAVP